jgi:crossover junction endodeoxyribonuclease RuvC
LLVLGIDPGTATTGYGLIETDGQEMRFREAGVFRSSSSLPLPSRIRTLCAQLDTLLDGCQPAGVAMEGIFHGRNVRSALTMAHVRGAFLLSLVRRGLEVSEYTPAEVKKALTGHGVAAKEQVREMVRRLLGLEEMSVSLDASDALALAICHAQVSRFQSRVHTRSA